MPKTYLLSHFMDTINLYFRLKELCRLVLNFSHDTIKNSKIVASIFCIGKRNLQGTAQ